MHKGKQNSRLQTLPKVDFWTSAWTFWCGVFSFVLHFVNWAFFGLSRKFCLQMLQCENSPAGEELFGGQFERVVPSLWLLLAFQNLFRFFNPL